MGKKIATFLTWCFHPLFIPTYGMGVLYLIFTGPFFLHDYRIPVLLLSITFITTGLLPALSAWILLRSGILKNLQMDDRRERLLPYLTTALYYLMAYYMFRSFPLPLVLLKIFRHFILAGCIGILLTTVINFFWKISAHTVAAGGWCGALTGLCLLMYDPPLPALFAVIGIAGVTGYARLKLEAHTPAQVYAGYLLGFACTFFLLNRV
ncbi:MAG: phosphatase PAP2 family protein [Bacteroidia bacterium]